MPRHARLWGTDIVYHVTMRGNNRSWIFEDDEDFNTYFDLCLKYKERYSLEIYHWVLMNNHVHLLIKPPEGRALSKAMQGIGLSYTIRFNRKYKRNGHLWQGRFKSFPVETSTYLLECGRYIERNPLRAGMIAQLADYPWSSYPFHALGKADSLTDTHPLLEEFSAAPEKRRATYRDYVHSNRDKEEQDLRTHFASGVIGSDAFETRLISAMVAARRPKRGRPRK